MRGKHPRNQKVQIPSKEYLAQAIFVISQDPQFKPRELIHIGTWALWVHRSAWWPNDVYTGTDNMSAALRRARKASGSLLYRYRLAATTPDLQVLKILTHSTFFLQSPFSKQQGAYKTSQGFSRFLLQSPFQNNTFGTSKYLCNRL